MNKFLDGLERMFFKQQQKQQTKYNKDILLTRPQQSKPELMIDNNYFKGKTNEEKIVLLRELLNVDFGVSEDIFIFTFDVIINKSNTNVGRTLKQYIYVIDNIILDTNGNLIRNDIFNKYIGNLNENNIINFENILKEREQFMFYRELIDKIYEYSNLINQTDFELCGVDCILGSSNKIKLFIDGVLISEFDKYTNFIIYEEGEWFKILDSNLYKIIEETKKELNDGIELKLKKYKQ